MTFFSIIIRVIGPLVLCAAGLAAQEKPRVLEIACKEGLRFSVGQLEAKPGEKLLIRLVNEDVTDQMHNIAILVPGSLKEVVDASLQPGSDGPARQFVPDSPKILAHTKLLATGQVDELNFTVPADPGIYPFVCTFPGHGTLMYGALYVGVKKPPADKDPNIPPSPELATKNLAPLPRPGVQRVFLPNATPAAIALALPGDQNALWDAGLCRLRTLWKGGFLSLDEHFRSNGSKLGKLEGTVWWSTPPDSQGFGFGAAKTPPKDLAFKGYRVKRGIATLSYRCDDWLIEETVDATEAGQVIRRFRCVEPGKEPLFFIPENTAQAQYMVDGKPVDGSPVAIPVVVGAELKIEMSPRDP